MTNIVKTFQCFLTVLPLSLNRLTTYNAEGANLLLDNPSFFSAVYEGYEILYTGSQNMRA